MPEETKRSFLKNVYDFARSILTGKKYVDIDYGTYMEAEKKRRAKLKEAAAASD